MSTRRHRTSVLTGTFYTLLLIGLAFTGISLAQTPPPATFVNPTLFNGGSVISNYSPIPVQALAMGDFNNDGVPDLLTLDDNGNTAGVGIMLGNGEAASAPSRPLPRLPVR